MKVISFRFIVLTHLFPIFYFAFLKSFIISEQNNDKIVINNNCFVYNPTNITTAFNIIAIVPDSVPHY